MHLSVPANAVKSFYTNGLPRIPAVRAKCAKAAQVMSSKWFTEYPKMDAISFKLEREISDCLLQLANASNEKSRHLFARKIVEDYVDRSGHDPTAEELVRIRQLMEHLREDLATMAAALLVHAGQIETLEEANAWAMKNLLPED